MRKLIPLAAVAGLAALCVPLAAQAATTPAAQLSLGASHIREGGAIRLHYSVRDLPSGSTVKLDGRMIGGTWKALPGQLGRQGVITESDSPAGAFQFKIVVTDGSRFVTASRIVTLTVRPTRNAGYHSSPSPWWGVLDSGVRGVAEGAAGAVAGTIITVLLCFFGLC